MTQGWIELFSVGMHTDSNENQKKWSLADLKKIVASYNPKKHEAPIVLGHPEDNSPAYGWVKALKVKQGKLLGQFAQVDKAFAKWVNEGKYKKRSISLYPDLSLRHVGYLGAMPPAVKGLEDHKFNEKSAQKDQCSFFEFASDLETLDPKKTQEQSIFYLLADGRFIDQDGTFYDLDSAEVTAYLEAGGELIGTAEEELTQATDKLEEETEQELEELKTEIKTIESQSEEGSEEQTETTDQDLGDQTDLETTELDVTPLEAEKKQLEEDYKNRLAQLEASHAQEKAKSFTEGLIARGTLTPAQSKGLPEFLGSLAQTSFEFGESQVTLDSKIWLQDFLEKLPTQGHLNALGTGGERQSSKNEHEQLIDSVIASTGCGLK